MQRIGDTPEMVSRVIPVEPFDLVIFGGTGDLARRKILPGLFRRFCAGQIPEHSRIIGAARSDIDDDGYRDLVREAIDGLPPASRAAVVLRDVHGLSYAEIAESLGITERNVSVRLTRARKRLRRQLCAA